MINFPESFTRSEKWLLQTAIVMGYAVKPVGRYYNHDDWFLDDDIWECFEKGERIILSCPDLYTLRSKPALTQSMDWGRNHTVTRLTKAGWKKAYELANRLMAETGNYAAAGREGEDFWLWIDNA